MNTTKILQNILADTFILYFKVHSFHWNVEGKDFVSLHAFFETIYNELWTSIDEIAERVRISGAYAPKSLSEMTSGAKIKESTGNYSDKEMLSILAKDLESVIDSHKDAINSLEEIREDAHAGYLVEKVDSYKKHLWMLKSLVK